MTAFALCTALLAGAAGCSDAGTTGAGARGQGGAVALSLAPAARPDLVEAVRAQAATAAWEAEAEALAAEAAPTATATTEQRRLAKTRFVANVGLAAGATYQWIVKPYKAGKFKKGTKGRWLALGKAGLAGAFAYNQLKRAVRNAEADPLLSKALAPLTAGIESLKGLGTKLRKGQVGDADISSLEGVINGVKDAGKSAGAEVVDKDVTVGQLTGG
ncbi:hypothetical protein [Streptomyces bambusae]|uniref:hypothetical protein n=1 Tax=Streptomyces bambusae TaxID=1550616 RepID=UPI0021F64019